MAVVNVEELTKKFVNEVNKTVFPSNGKNLSTPLASTFERCSYFVIVNSNQENAVTAFLNDAQTAARGADIQAAQLLVDQQIEIVITLQIDFVALNILQKAGIRVYLGIDGTIQENIDLYQQRKLVEIRTM